MVLLPASASARGLEVPFSSSALRSSLTRDPGTGFIRPDFVSQAEFDENLAAATEAAREFLRDRYPRLSSIELDQRLESEGFLGPQSATWEVHRVSQLFWAFPGIIQLFQNLEDPLGAQGVFDRSDRIRRNVAERLENTGTVMSRIVLGSQSESSVAARRLFHRHSRVITGSFPAATGMFAAGQEYRASSARSLAYVHVTHAQMKLRVYESVYIRTGRVPMTPEEFNAFSDRYYRESRIIGLLFGIPPEFLPGSHAEVAEFLDTFHDSGYLCHSPAAQAIENSVRGQIEGLRASRVFRFIPPARWAVSIGRWLADHWTVRHLPGRDRAVLTNTGLPSKNGRTADGVLDAIDRVTDELLRHTPDALLVNTDYGLAVARTQGGAPALTDRVFSLCLMAMRKLGRR